MTLPTDWPAPSPDHAIYQQWWIEARQSLPAPDELASLLVMLRWWAEVDRREIQNPELPNGLTACERSVYEVLKFLDGQKLAKTYNCGAALMRLHAAFQDIADGNSPALFRPVKSRPGRPGKGVTNATVQGYAARTLSELIDAGDDTSAAANRVAKAVRKSRPELKTATGAMIVNWRERLMQGGGPGAPALAVAHFNEPLEQRWGATPRERGENLLKQIERRGSSLG